MEQYNETNSISQQAIASANNGILAFCKFLSANDTGLTGGHQCGIYIPKPAYSLIFDKKGVKGTNMTRKAKICWQGSYESESSFKYYGCGSRNEYRITRFGRGFDLLSPDKTKYLCTLQQGISPQQLHEMKRENVVLVVPAPYIHTYPKEYREEIFSLAKFIKLVQEKTIK